MPLWRIYSHPDTFTKEQKAGLAKAITKLYTDAPVSLPAFYANVLFIPLQEDEIWVGGESRKNFVRLTIEQIARTMDGAETEEGRARRKWWMDKINDGLKPWIADRPELMWEHHIAEHPRDLWRVQGLDPPPSYSEAELEWTRTNKPAAWEKL